MLEVLVLVQTMEDNNVEHQNPQEEECNSMLVSYEGPTKGKAIFARTQVLWHASFSFW